MDENAMHGKSFDMALSWMLSLCLDVMWCDVFVPVPPFTSSSWIVFDLYSRIRIFPSMLVSWEETQYMVHLDILLGYEMLPLCH